MTTNVDGDLFSNFVREDENTSEDKSNANDNNKSVNNNNNGVNNSEQEEEENYITKLKEMVKEYSQLDQQEPSSDDELIKFTKDKEERLLFRLGRLLEKRKKQRKRKYEQYEQDQIE
ncbi:predicted protein [Naegleria gruberi]|uniref:Predicted protein n=1 Tax=Naegleria gruberi TaxID=5762 RepID=D2VA86_NAEGR|nr:uncharacterized protein NAEGRDRAFT_65773 [Naegleria gruberi]EFC46386.1 predicted protein [Naegleria gruberi]|eukprot:XP_002679130.1 predicted protein [Naegleria gruberi strain NEG-M]